MSGDQQRAQGAVGHLRAGLAFASSPPHTGLRRSVASADMILFVSASQMMSAAGFGVESEFAWAIVRGTRRRLLLEGLGDLSADGAGAACSSHTCRYRRRLPRLSLGPRCVKGQRNLPIGGRETASGQLSCPLPGSYVAVSGQDLVAAGSACLAVPARVMVATDA